MEENRKALPGVKKDCCGKDELFSGADDPDFFCSSTIVDNILSAAARTTTISTHSRYSCLSIIMIVVKRMLNYCYCIHAFVRDDVALAFCFLQGLLLRFALYVCCLLFLFFALDFFVFRLSSPLSASKETDYNLSPAIRSTS